MRTSKTTSLFLNTAQANLISFIAEHGCVELARSLKLLHTLALYHSTLSIEEEEALIEVILLMEGMK